MTAEVQTSLILALYARAWGMPEFSRTMSKEAEQVTAYSFPQEALTRFATVGASGLKKDQASADFELFMVLPNDLAGATFDEVTSMLFDVVAYGVRPDVRMVPGYAVPPSPLVPKSWNTRALLIDEPVGEPEDLATMHIGPKHIDLLWVVPIYKSEYHYIQQQGVERFYELADGSEWSLVDPTRPALAL